MPITRGGPKNDFSPTRAFRAAILTALIFVGLATTCPSEPIPKRVLIVHSFGSVAPPFTNHSVAFETELVDTMGERIDLDEVSLDMARYTDPDLQEALVEYLQKRHAKWRPDLVVPVGSPAGVFVAHFRDRLFPNIPILYTGMDKRRLPPGELQNNAAFVGEDFDLPGFVEDILQIAPETQNIAVVIGASPVEQFWATAFREAFQPYNDRINFIWLNDLSLDQMLEKVSKLPPRSFVFLILLLRDAAGVSHNGDEALQRLHAVANAPINSIFQHQLGLGIVGGRLYQAEMEGIESARIALRILHGEPASNFPPKIVGPLPPRYDWRELQRWNLKESRLPADRTVLFRSPTVWEQYRGWIVTGVTVLLLQTLLVIGLIANLVRRHRAEIERKQAEELFRLSTEASPSGILLVNDRGQIILVNTHIEELFGYRRAELIGNPVEILIPERLTHDWAALSSGALVPGEKRKLGGRLELFGKRKDGTSFPVEIGLNPIQSQQGVLVLASVTDISTRKLAEEQARQRRETMSRLSRITLLGEMTASIAHEINQPLSGIISNASAGQRFIDRGNHDPNALREILEDIVTDGRRAHDVVHNIRNTLKKGPALRKKTDLNEVVMEVARMVQPDAQAHSCELKMSLRDNLPPIDGNPIQIQQVLINLIGNAFDAVREMPAHQRRVEVATEPDGDNAVILSVRDHGTGVSEEMRERIFEQFFTTKEEGLGLGLAIVQSIVESHSGTIRVENPADGGARFCCVLPVSR